VSAPVRIPPRFELKYVIPASLVPLLLERLEGIAEPDAATRESPRGRYAIHSLYLDGPTLPFYRAKVERAPRRLKLRIRGYPDDPSASVFFELKRKIGDVVKKARQPVPLSTWTQIAEDGPSLDDAPVLHDFFATMVRATARPTLLVRYERIGYQSLIDDYARVTVDHALAFAETDAFSLDADPRDWRALDDTRTLGGVRAGVILELKFAERPPMWMASLARGLGLERRGFSKYCSGIEHLRLARANLGLPGRLPLR